MLVVFTRHNSLDPIPMPKVPYWSRLKRAKRRKAKKMRKKEPKRLRLTGGASILHRKKINVPIPNMELNVKAKVNLFFHITIVYELYDM